VNEDCNQKESAAALGERGENALANERFIAL